MTKRILFIILFSFGSLYGHQDRIIHLEGDILIGLPDSYESATFSKEKKSIQIGENIVSIPKCIWEKLFQSKKAKMEFRASWHHNLELIPPYFVILSEEPNSDESIKLMISLDTLELIHFEKEIRHNSTEGTYFSYEAIEIKESCLDLWIIDKK